MCEQVGLGRGWQPDWGPVFVLRVHHPTPLQHAGTRQRQAPGQERQVPRMLLHHLLPQEPGLPRQKATRKVDQAVLHGEVQVQILPGMLTTLQSLNCNQIKMRV